MAITLSAMRTCPLDATCFMASYVQSIDRYMRAAPRVKGAPLPVRESVNKTHSRNAGHQIHLTWCDQTADDRLHRNTLLGEADVIFFEQLCDWIVAGNIEHHPL